jgi:mannan endo-1,4-beta-mannosidase
VIVRGLIVVLAAWSCAASAQFVRADGARFVAGEQAFHVVGANAAVMHGPDQRGSYAETLGAAAADGLGVVRIWALGEYPEGTRPYARAYSFRIGPDGWVEESYLHLDRVLAEARRLGLRVVIVLANRWGDYGGIPQYLAWSGHAPLGRHPPALALTAFWECTECEARYREHVRRLVTRVSSVTGVRYADDPTIFSWELINEAEAAGAVGEASYLRWVERQAAFVRELDPNHMIAAGHIGYASTRTRSLWARACEVPQVSYCDSHAYPLREGRVRSAQRLERWVDDRVQLAHDVVQKPILFGEIGVPNDRRSFYGRDRSAWLALFFQRVIANGAAGAMIWTYLPSAGDPRTYAVYAHGDRARQTRDLRRVLAVQAERVRGRSPSVRTLAVEPFDASVRLRGPGTVHRNVEPLEDGAALVRIDPLAFERARFEGAGTWGGNPGVPHFYGGGIGEVSYLLRRPPGMRALSSLRVRVRASSELPGAGGGVSEADTSELAVDLDGVALGTIVAPPDDGLGNWVELTVDDPAVLSAIRSRATHRLRITANGNGAGGVCLYGRTERDEPAGIEVVWTGQSSSRPEVILE